MALNFPLNPADGDTYENYVYDATEGVWNANPQQLASRFITSATQPSTPSNGDGWLDTNTGKTYIYYNDGSSAQWIESGNPVIGFVDPYDQDSTSTGYFSLPKGTSAQRPVAPSNGDIRFNTELNQPEWYSAATDQWVLFKDGPTFDLQYLVIAGGGGGGAANLSSSGGGGGGAGGYRSSSIGESSGQGASAESVLNITAGTYEITVGAGGSGKSGSGQRGDSGSNSIFDSIVSLGGGGGGGSFAGANEGGGGSGGSGGGAGAQSGITVFGGSGTLAQGFDGGNSSIATSDVPNYPSAGGGGAGAVGQDAQSTSVAGDGGAGLESSITGSSVFRAGGGGGSTYNGGSPGTGGIGGGGNGGNYGVGVTSGDTNTGSGGGGSSNDTLSGSGGSGIVILKYPSLYTATPSVGLTSTTSTVGDYKVIQFTAGTGTVTFS